MFRWRVGENGMVNDTFDEKNRRKGFWLMEDVGLSTQTTIFHYTDLGYLLQMFDSGSFYVSRKLMFDDLTERELLTKDKLFAFSIVSNGTSNDDTPYIQRIIDAKRKQFRIQSSEPTSCWSQGPNENILLWRCYTKQNTGVCIKTTIGKFVESLNNDCYDIWCGKMKYERRQQTTGLDEALWMKPPEYSGENEVRFYFRKRSIVPFGVRDYHESVFIGFDYRLLVDEILLSPYMSNEEVKIWTKHIADSYKLRNDQIKKSPIPIL